VFSSGRIFDHQTDRVFDPVFGSWSVRSKKRRNDLNVRESGVEAEGMPKAV
jgi:hypothetical protein